MGKQWHPLVELKSFCQKKKLFQTTLSVWKYFQANAIDDEKKVPVFLSIGGGNIYTLLHSLLSPTKPQAKPAASCKFGGNLEESLRDRFVCGLRSEITQKQLLTEADLTFKRAVEIAKGIKAAETKSEQFKKAEPV